MAMGPARLRNSPSKNSVPAVKKNMWRIRPHIRSAEGMRCLLGVNFPRIKAKTPTRSKKGRAGYLLEMTSDAARVKRDRDKERHRFSSENLLLDRDNCPWSSMV